MEKKILIISQNFYPEIGSAGNRIKNIYKQLKANGVKVNILTTTPTYPNRKIFENEEFWDDEDLNNDKTHIRRISVTNKKYSFSIINRLWFYIEVALKMILYIFKDKNTYDVVLVSSPPIFIGFVGIIAKWKYKSQLLLDIRDLWPESLKGVGVFNYPIIIWTFSLLEKLLYKISDEIIVNSKGFIDYIKNKANIADKNITHIPNGAISKEVFSVPDKKRDRFKVIYAGNIGLAQDENILRELAQKLKTHNIQLTIIGYGFNKQGLEKEITEGNLANVIFINPKTREDTLELIRHHDIGIVTLNDKEVFDTVLPGKVIDYMTCGVPIVASVSGFSKEVITRAKVGYVSDSKNADEMLEKILHLYNNPDEKMRFSTNGLSYVKEHYLWEKNIEQLIGLIKANSNHKKENEE